MTGTGPYPARVDPVHILGVCAEAAPRGRRDTAILIGGRYAAQVYLPTRAAARAAHMALCRVGYQADPATRRGRDLIVHGWSAGALEARLTAMRAVLQQLAADPESLAAAVLDQLRDVPLAELPGPAGQRRLITQASKQLRRWIFRSSGIHAPHDPRVPVAETGCALRVSAAWQLEYAIEDIAARRLRVAAHALELYPGLRAQRDHDGGRDSALRQAGIAFLLPGRPVPRDTSPFPRNPGGSPDAMPAAAPDAIPGRAASTGFRAGPSAAREFPGTGWPLTPGPRPPLGGPDRPRGRNFPAGRAGPRP